MLSTVFTLSRHTLVSEHDQGIGVYLVYTLCIQIVYKTEVHFGKGKSGNKLLVSITRIKFDLDILLTGIHRKNQGQPLHHSFCPSISLFEHL